MPLGLQIGVKKTDIDTIEAQYNAIDRRFLEVLTARLKQSPALTWADISKALRSQSVNEPRLADDIEQRHGSTSAAAGFQGNSDEEDLGTIKGEENVTEYNSKGKESNSGRVEAQVTPREKKESLINKSDEIQTEFGGELHYPSGKALGGTTREGKTAMLEKIFYPVCEERPKQQDEDTQLQRGSVSLSETTEFSCTRKFHSERADPDQKRRQENSTPQASKSLPESEEENEHVAGSRERTGKGKSRGKKRQRVTRDSPLASSTHSSSSSSEVRGAKAGKRRKAKHWRCRRRKKARRDSSSSSSESDSSSSESDDELKKSDTKRLRRVGSKTDDSAHPSGTSKGENTYGLTFHKQPTTPTMSTPLVSRSLPKPHVSRVLKKYKKFLRSCYKARPLAQADKYIPTLKVPYINLAMVSKEEYSPKQRDEFTRHTLHGGVDEILKKKTPINIEDLLTPEGSHEPVRFILVEGPPGIGKSTFAWELCRRWDKIKGLSDYHTIVLLRLREKWVLNAVSLPELFRYQSDPD